MNAFSPQAELVEHRKVRLSAGQTAEADFTLRFDQNRYANTHPAPSSSITSPPPPPGGPSAATNRHL